MIQDRLAGTKHTVLTLECIRSLPPGSKAQRLARAARFRVLRHLEPRHTPYLFCCDEHWEPVAPGPDTWI